MNFAAWLPAAAISQVAISKDCISRKHILASFLSDARATAEIAASGSVVEQVGREQGSHCDTQQGVQLAETVNRSVMDDHPHHQRYQRRDRARMRGQGSISVPIKLDSVLTERDEEGKNIVSDYLAKTSVYKMSPGRTASHPASVWPSLR